MNKPLRIAIADDELVVREYLSEILPLLGHEVVAAAENGFDLVEACRLQHPDLIIADVRMQGLDGDDAIREIFRERPTPFILISAFSKPRIQPNGFDGVCWVYLPKPVRREDLERAIQEVFPGS
jgi:CheY-like chemotaxis protein